MILVLHSDCQGDWESLRQRAGLSASDLKGFLEYACQFLGNIGNYKAVGDVKFIPRISDTALSALTNTSSAASALYARTKGAILASSDPQKMHLGYPEDGHVSTYYPDSPTITKQEITLIGDFLESRGFEFYNTLLQKDSSGNFKVLVASASATPLGDGINTDANPTYILPSTGPLANKTVTIAYGYFSTQLCSIANEMTSASAFAANDDQSSMLSAYAASFLTGSTDDFRASQRHWIRDKCPVVECNIGFIESYRDPHGVRAEWEGFAAIVNKERTRAFSRLVAAAPSMVPKLPWPAAFEKDGFLSPDFTSLEVLSFAGSMIPAGINIPNLDDVRQTEGFKNVSLGNVLSAKSPDEPIPFLHARDTALFAEHRDAAFEVQVGIHELLGHGTGKLLQETSKGVYNFPTEPHPPIQPLTGSPVTTWYTPGQTWGSVFGSIAASYEECRAECVAMALSCDFGILEVFGFGDGHENLSGPAGDILYVAYLQMARAGLMALEYYDPRSRKWGQAHAQARFSILKCFLEDGEGFVRLEGVDGDRVGDLVIRLDRHGILGKGRSAVEGYLRKLHIYKCTAEVEKGKELYERMTRVDDWWGGPVRDEVLKRKSPRKVFVQANTVLDGEGDVAKVRLLEYPATIAGMIQSWAERAV